MLLCMYIFSASLNGIFGNSNFLYIMSAYKISFPCLLLGLFLLFSCKNEGQYKSPAGYTINKPGKTVMPYILDEISGIAFLKGNDDTIFAVNDESGKLYSFSFASKKVSSQKFGKKADFEDITILNNNTVAILKSDGALLLFPVAEIGKNQIDNVHTNNHILPEGEYEGIFAADGKLYVLCKNCPDDKEKKEVSVCIVEQVSGINLRFVSSFKIDVSKIQEEGVKGKVKFHPSCMAKHPVTQEWFIISAVNKVMIILDNRWKVKEYYRLDPSLFKQPEGLAFNSKGDMYISNEGAGGSANILQFKYHSN